MASRGYIRMAVTAFLGASAAVRQNVERVVHNRSRVRLPVLERIERWAAVLIAR